MERKKDWVTGLSKTAKSILWSDVSARDGSKHLETDSLRKKPQRPGSWSGVMLREK